MKLLLVILSNSVYFSCSAQIDTVSIKNNNLQTKYLVQGTSTYLNWMKDTKSGLVSNISISKRSLHFQKFAGKDVIVVAQHKLNNDSSKIKFIYPVSDRLTFKTIYDYVESPGGKFKTLKLSTPVISYIGNNQDVITGTVITISHAELLQADASKQTITSLSKSV